MVFKKSFILLVATATMPFFAFVSIIFEQDYSNQKSSKSSMQLQNCLRNFPISNFYSQKLIFMSPLRVISRQNPNGMCETDEKKVFMHE